MADGIPLQQKGKGPTFLDAEYANQIVRIVNSLASMVLSPAGAGKLVINENNTVLDLGPLVQKLEAVALAVQQTTPPQLADILNRLNNLENAVTNLGNAITNINNRLASASGTGTVTCNPDGSFTISITINI